LKTIDQLSRKLNTEEDTRAFGLEIAEALEPGDVVALIGDLGTGKTALTKYIAEGLGITEEINSPTFTIVKEYRSGRLPLYHFDVYRVVDPEVLFEIGAEEYFYAGGVSIVEWADMVAEILPEETICIFIEYGEKEGERIYQCTF
jgi:tRNA threonylcarbamoyladenosine biosynthesis protein TsaE